MALQSGLVLAFAQALTELVTVEKKNIVVLTEIARDAISTEPRSAPSLAALITSRVLQAPASQKLPALYLLDSVSKLVGEPYKTLFAASLPEVFINTWQAGGPGLHRPLDKLLGTWTGIYPDPLLAEIQGRLRALRAAAAPAQLQPPAGHALPGYGHMQVQQQQPAGYGMPQYQQQYQQQQQQQPGYGGYTATYPAAAPMQQQQPYYQQQPPPLQAYGASMPPPQQLQQQAYGALQQQQQPQQQQPAAQQLSVPDLLSSLMTAGLLAGPGQQQQPAAAAPLRQAYSGGSGALMATPPYVSAALTATPEREQPATTKFTPERLKEPNPSAVSRLLRQTEQTKSRFLDRKFVRRQQKQAGASARGSRMYYLELDTWLDSTVGQAAAAGGGTGGVSTAAGKQAAGAAAAAAVAAAAAALDPSRHSVPVDDCQTHCALSGEQFEQFWDERHQEWRYRGAKALDAEEAARYGLEQGSIVLVSALGAPADVPGGVPGGVLSELAAQREVADDLAAAAAASSGQSGTADVAAAAAAAAVGVGVGVVIKEENIDHKHMLSEEAAAVVAAYSSPPLEKRQRVA